MSQSGTGKTPIALLALVAGLFLGCGDFGVSGVGVGTQVERGTYESTWRYTWDSAELGIWDVEYCYGTLQVNRSSTSGFSGLSVEEYGEGCLYRGYRVPMEGNYYRGRGQVAFYYGGYEGWRAFPLLTTCETRWEDDYIELHYVDTRTLRGTANGYYRCPTRWGWADLEIRLDFEARR